MQKYRRISPFKTHYKSMQSLKPFKNVFLHTIYLSLKGYWRKRSKTAAFTPACWKILEKWPGRIASQKKILNSNWMKRKCHHLPVWKSLGAPCILKAYAHTRIHPLTGGAGRVGRGTHQQQPSLPPCNKFKSSYHWNDHSLLKDLTEPESQSSIIEMI